MKFVMFLIILTLVSFCNGCGESSSSPHPTDRQMISIFQAHRKDFEELLTLFNENKIEEIGLDDLRTDNSNSYKRFKILMLVTGTKTISIRGGDRSHVEFVVSVTGWATGGTCKGYVWSAIRETPIVDRLDDPKNKIQDSTAYRQIEDDWYIFYQHDG